MVWIFAVVAVALMAAVAAVAAGHGTPLAPEHGDRPDAGLPAHDGPVSATDLRRVRFPVVLRGYRMAEVDALLERLAAEREFQEVSRPSITSGPTSGTASGTAPGRPDRVSDAGDAAGAADEEN